MRITVNKFPPSSGRPVATTDKDKLTFDALFNTKLDFIVERINIKEGIKEDL